ncbi:MAG: undecaprenyl-phosphate glucose phosphotransferase [Lachnospiraceae bacterium]|nr:undecaprenyl-phosphate glucose phosphotransferase [Lachnospiraceae bacterium]
MIRDNQVMFNRFHILLDGAVTALSFVLSWMLKFMSPWSEFRPGINALRASVYFQSLILIVPLYLILYSMSNLYTSKRVTRIRTEVAGILRANTIGVVVIMVALFLIQSERPEYADYSRSLIALFYVVNIFLTTLYRYLLRKALYYFRRRGNNLKHILLVGYSRAAEAYLDRIQNNAQWGYVAHGILDDHVPAGTMYRGVKVLGTIGNLEYILPENKLDEIAITLSLQDYDDLEKIVDMCEKSGVHTKFIPDYTSLFPSSPYTEDLMGLPVINIRYVPLTNTLNAFVKRTMDIVGAIICIVLFSPLMLMAVIGTKLSSKGPVIFRQERVGRHGKNFTMYKFRTMEVQTKEEEARGWTTRGDARVTKFGSFLRRTSIDEMPQFFNVLSGKMSLVGPRPERPQFVEKFREEIPRYMVKHQVRPGITGWAQVNGYRGDTSIRRRIEYDLYYIENWSVGFDLKILFLTVFRGFINKNAY